MLTLQNITTFVGGSEKRHPLEGSAADVIREMFEDWVACDTIKFEGGSRIELWYPPKGVLSGVTTIISGTQDEMSPLFYLFGIYFEQLAFAKGPVNDAKRLEIVLTTCCETFGLDSQEFIPKGWPEIAQYMGAWLAEWEELKKS